MNAQLPGARPPFRRRTHPWLRRSRRIAGRGLAFALAVAGAALFLYPLLWIVSVALYQPGSSVSFFGLTFSRSPHWSTFADAVSAPYLPNNFLRNVWNSTWYTSLAVLGNTLVSAVVGYAFARLRAAGATTLFFVMLATIMMPVQVTLIPRIVLFRLLGWIDTPLPLIVPACFGSAFSIFLLRQFFRTLPRELDEAATIDGLGYLGIFWRIIVPQATPALATVALLGFFANWTDLLNPLIFLNTPSKFPVSLALTQVDGGFAVSRLYPALAALLLVGAAPCLLLFLVGQRYLSRGIVIADLLT